MRSKREKVTSLDGIRINISVQRADGRVFVQFIADDIRDHTNFGTSALVLKDTIKHENV